MRIVWILTVVAGLALATGCTSAYDTELLGEPELAPAPELAAQSPDTTAVPDDAYQQPPDSLAMFDDLDSYGSWYELQPFGMVWRPTVISSWRPMQTGYWAWTSYGWMWVSNDPFGWATYHYGYWANDFTLGWVWIPDYTWYPCQADWITMGDYVCWAPLPPPGHPWRDPWYHDDYWTVVPVEKFHEPDVARYKVPPAKFKAAYKSHQVTRSAPDTQYVERYTHGSIQPVDVELSKQRYGNREITRVRFPGSGMSGAGAAGFTSQPMSPPLTSPGIGGGGGGNTGSSGNQAQRPAKSKSPSPPPASTEPRKYKAKAPKDDSNSGTSKEKAKGGSNGDSGNSGEKSKDDSGKGDSSPSKAKGKKG